MPYVTSKPWCGSFVSWVAEQAGIKLPVSNPLYVWSYVQGFGDPSRSGEKQYAQQNNSYYPASSGYIPCAGDLIVFGTPGSGHIGIVVEYNQATKKLRTVEGNYDNKVSNNGYEIDDPKITGYCSLSRLLAK